MLVGIRRGGVVKYPVPSNRNRRCGIWTRHPLHHDEEVPEYAILALLTYTR